MDLQKFMDVGQSADLKTFETKLVDFAHEMDFERVGGMLIVDKPGMGQEVYSVGNVPEEYKTSFDSADDIRRDPVMRRLKRSKVPVVYDQALYVGEGAGDLWEVQAPFGYKTGIILALHLSDHRHFVLGVDRHEDLPEGSRDLTRMIADLQLLAVYCQDAAMRLFDGSPRHLANVQLTKRELEVLRWTMDGKSSWVVGEILSLSESTVNFHLRNAMQKLDSTSKHQAVLKAIALGLL